MGNVLRDPKLNCVQLPGLVKNGETPYRSSAFWEEKEIRLNRISFGTLFVREKRSKKLPIRTHSVNLPVDG